MVARCLALLQLPQLEPRVLLDTSGELAEDFAGVALSCDRRRRGVFRGGAHEGNCSTQDLGNIHLVVFKDGVDQLSRAYQEWGAACADSAATDGGRLTHERPSFPGGAAGRMGVVTC